MELLDFYRPDFYTDSNMRTRPKAGTDAEVRSLLRCHGISPTAQRMRIVQVLFAAGAHLSADDLFHLVNSDRVSNGRVSKATVYNTLALLAAKGAIRAVIADPARIFYDPNTRPHHHFYYEDVGELADIDAADIDVARLPPLPEGSELKGVDVVIRVRRTCTPK